jgi:hypothetical protein
MADPFIDYSNNFNRAENIVRTGNETSRTAGDYWTLEEAIAW